MYIQEKDKQSDLIRKRRVIVKEEDKKRILSMCHSEWGGWNALWTRKNITKTSPHSCNKSVAQGGYRECLRPERKRTKGKVGSPQG